jgi:hypothetical protein
MKARKRNTGATLIRAADRLFDALAMRPLGIIVFAGSVYCLLQLIGMSGASIRVEAVAVGTMVEHPSKVASFAIRVFVKPGDHVDIGSPLVELSPYFLDQRIARLNGEIEQLINESKLAQAQLVVKEERWVNPAMRLRPKRPSLESPTADFYAKQIESLRVRRDMLIEDRESLLVKSDFEGVVEKVTWPGAAVAEGGSVATVMPEFADEIVAFVEPTTDPGMIDPGAFVRILGAEGSNCRDVAVIRRRGASVEEAPAQLKTFLGGRVHGMPVHISVPENCRLGNGQIVTVDLKNESTG